MVIRFLFLKLALLLAAAPTLLSAGPTHIRIQGRLTDGNGAPIVGDDVRIRVGLYPVVSGGSLAWETPADLSVATNDAGLFATDVGPIPPMVFSGNSDLYLELRVRDAGGMKTLSPRQKLATVPYASHAQSAGAALSAGTANAVIPNAIGSIHIQAESITTHHLATGAVTSDIIADGTISGIDMADQAVTNRNVAEGSLKRDRLDEASFQTAGAGLVPQGAIFMFLGAVCPTGYEEVVEFRNRFVMGADVANTDPDIPNSPGQTLGSKTHSHNIAHGHGTGIQQDFTGEQQIDATQEMVYFSNPKLIKGVAALSIYDWVQLIGYDHSHQTNSQNTVTSGETLTLPPALTTIFCRKQ